MNDRIKPDDEIETTKQRENFKRLLLRLLDDPQVRRRSPLSYAVQV
jgi:hypothetical protein